MHPYLKDIVSGSLAGGLSMLVLALRGRAEKGSAVAPLNAPSHWLHGERALRQTRPSWRYTATGALIHHASALMWGGIFNRLIGKRGPATHPAKLAAGAAVMTAVAALVDFKMVPERLTPGFQHHLSRKSLVLTYGAFAAGLALAAMATRAQASRDGKTVQ
ncbi:MAG: hypothetical protein EOP36_04860 [Rubrivivax sp.]|nr:MAG: hypothetical protein EOP36_04860 [Rubrivivax sp.]